MGGASHPSTNPRGHQPIPAVRCGPTLAPSQRGSLVHEHSRSQGRPCRAPHSSGHGAAPPFRRRTAARTRAPRADVARRDRRSLGAGAPASRRHPGTRAPCRAAARAGGTLDLRSCAARRIARRMAAGARSPRRADTNPHRCRTRKRAPATRPAPSVVSRPSFAEGGAFDLVFVPLTFPGACRGPSSWPDRSVRAHSSAQPSGSRARGPTSRGTLPARDCSACADGA